MVALMVVRSKTGVSLIATSRCCWKGTHLSEGGLHQDVFAAGAKIVVVAAVVVDAVVVVVVRQLEGVICVEM